jgi:hypothetical protein
VLGFLLSDLEFVLKSTAVLSDVFGFITAAAECKTFLCDLVLEVLPTQRILRQTVRQRPRELAGCSLEQIYFESGPESIEPSNVNSSNRIKAHPSVSEYMRQYLAIN